MREFWMRYMSLVAIVLLGCTGCTDETLVESSAVGEEEVWITLPFGGADFEQQAVATRSTLGEVAESRVKDLYLFIFAADGTNAYNCYFGDDTKKSTADEVRNAGNEQCWYVSNRSSETNTDQTFTTADTYGYIHIRSPKVTGGTLYLIANANAYTVNISPDKLSTIRTEAELKQLTATLNGEVVTRYGYFPMVAKVEGMSVSETDITSTGSDDTGLPARLIRLDSKVTVKVRAAAGYSYTHTTVDGEERTQTVQEFTPESWRVVNVPKGAYILDYAGNDDGISGYFKTEAIGFESIEDNTYDSKPTTLYGFSFYMLENRYSTTGLSYYYQRDLRSKNENGTYATTGNMWANAPKNATYLEIKGYLSMNVNLDENTTQELGANVTYYVHLGDFGKDVNNFAIERNTHYTYTITIKGVENIEVEVETSKSGQTFREEQPGATGDVFMSKAAVKLFDAHYSQYVYSLTADQLDVDQMSWYVRTPFGLKGSPTFNRGTENRDYDYKWIWIMINPKGSDGSYDSKNQWYPGNQNRTGGTAGKTKGDMGHLMDVNEFVSYIKEEKEKLDDGDETTTSIFANDAIVYFTVFVDEYYYEAHPITGETPVDLWKQFVNQPNRLMHILCGSSISLDEESSVTNSVITIRQRAIQTPYNISLSAGKLPTAWGCEVVDETDAHFWFYSPTETSSETPTALSVNNTSFENGRYNTACLWNLVSESGTFAEMSWETYLNYERDNPNENDLTDNGFLNTDYAAMLYAPMLRNRDNNGNKKIDADEIRWYIASIGQLYGLYMGELGMNGDARLYPLSKVALYGQTYNTGVFSGINMWRSHIVSSTSQAKGSHPRKLWAEEGLSVDNYGDYKSWAAHSIRCVRNLGMNHVGTTDEDKEQAARTALINAANEPESLIQRKEDVTITGSDGNNLISYRFDLRNLNADALRSKTEIELESDDEHSYMSRLYEGFETGETVTITGNWNGLKAWLDAGESFCPVGYRAPNVREGALISLYCQDATEDYYLVGSLYSLGAYGSYPNVYPSAYTWFYNGSGHVTVGSQRDNNNLRCVRDWTPE